MQIIETGLKFDGLRARRSTSLIVLHHSASPDVSAATIHAWHLARGWAGIGYHFVIRKNGDIERGRPLEMIGAHAGSGVNGSSIGICLSGDFMQDAPEPAQITSLLKLIDWLNQYYAPNNPQGLDIKLHREVAATLCPGDMFPVEQIRPLRKAAADDKGEASVEAWKTELMQEAHRLGLTRQEHHPDEPAPKWFVLAVAINLLESIK